MGVASADRGDPRTLGEIEALVTRMAEENRDWGYRRIQGALSNLGHEIARSTIASDWWVITAEIGWNQVKLKPAQIIG